MAWPNITTDTQWLAAAVLSLNAEDAHAFWGTVTGAASAGVYKDASAWLAANGPNRSVRKEVELLTAEVLAVKSAIQELQALVGKVQIDCIDADGKGQRDFHLLITLD